MKRKQIHERISTYAMLPYMDAIHDLKVPEKGMSKKEADNARLVYGANRFIGEKQETLGKRLRRSFINPFSLVLLFLACIYCVTDIFFSTPYQRNFATVIVISMMLLVSGIVRFVQEYKSKRNIEELTKLISNTVSVKRSGKWVELASDEIAVGDFVRLTVGQRVPADLRLIKTEDCFISESVLSGESHSIAKTTEPLTEKPEKISDYTNTAFFGSTVIGGSCEGLVLAVGNDTLYGEFSHIHENRKRSFDKGSNSIAWILIKFMIILVPLVFVVSVLTKGNLLAAFIFSLSVAVGLTPELLPMVITACLARGSYTMGKKQTIVKNINAIQNFGSMDVLCVDKTGTLTEDKLILEYYMDVLGNESREVLDCGFLNAYYHSGMKNHLDKALLDVKTMPNYRRHCRKILEAYQKTDEIPFDYVRKMSSVTVKTEENLFLIAKGNPDEILRHCRYVYYRGQTTEICGNAMESVHAVVDDMLEDGMKVLAVAVKKMQGEVYTSDEETDLTLIGYLCFFDAPKKSAERAIQTLKTLNMDIKVLTGDHLRVAESICRRLKIPTEWVLTGSELEKLSDNDIQIVVEKTSVFAELTPGQKAKIVNLLQSNGHTVGFLGDGINDLQAVMEANVGISVDTASPAVKESADVILLKKDLGVLEEGVVEGRKAFANMSKYVKITASSNLGNIIAIVIAGVMLPFFPMTSVQILLLNLLYDILCLVLPWDFVDREMCEKPLEWSGRTLSRFMLCFGPVSSVFDIATFAFLFFYICPALCGGPFAALGAEGQAQFISLFQTGWFLESMWTQVLILHLLRTEHVSIRKWRASKPVYWVTVCGVILFTAVAVTPVGKLLGFTSLPFLYYVFLIGTVICYMLTVSVVKQIYLKHNHRLIA